MAAVGVFAVFPEVEPLPGAERRFALRDGDAEVDGGEGCSHVGGHVVFAFGGVFEDLVAIRDEAFEEAFEVAADFGVRVFLDQEGSGGVLEVEGGDPVGDFGFLNEGGELVSEFVKAAALSGDGDLV